MRIFVVTAFPQLLNSPLSESILKRAQEKKLVEIKMVDLRDFTDDKHKQVDDYPYGGGPGMILKPEPFFKAVENIKIIQLSSSKTVVFESAPVWGERRPGRWCGESKTSSEVIC